MRVRNYEMSQNQVSHDSNLVFDRIMHGKNYSSNQLLQQKPSYFSQPVLFELPDASGSSKQKGSSDEEKKDSN